MIERDAEYYTAGHKGENPLEAPLYLRSLVFDGQEGDINTALVDKFNKILDGKMIFDKTRLSFDGTEGEKVPSKIIVINASHDNLPTSYEIARVFENLCISKGYKISFKVVNTKEELLKEVDENPDETLIVSQCVDKKVYDVFLADKLEGKGTVIVPGKVTAPGSVFSDKDSTYRLLSNEGKDWGSVAEYKKISVQDKDIKEVVKDILDAVDEFKKLTSKDTYFIKPHEGGGGLGGFRITKTEKGYIIPDLSKVSGDVSSVHPTFINFDVTNEAKLRELLWIYKLFSSDAKLKKNYLKVELPVLGVEEKEALKILKQYLSSTLEKQKSKIKTITIDRQTAQNMLISAITIFEQKFKKRYEPLVNEHIDFGLWGLRAHYRLSRKGPVLETMYHRIFQLAFTEEGLGYMGSDNISNKQTGDLEITRLGPVNNVMVESIGGEKKLFETLLMGVEALVALSDLLPETEKEHVPLRVQLDLAAVSQRIGEGNADTARGLCLASRWSEFVRNAEEWLEDSFAYYNWKKNKK